MGAGGGRGGGGEEEEGEEGEEGQKLYVSQKAYTLGLPRGAGGKESTCQCRRHKRCRFDPWVGWQPTPVFLPGKSHGQRNLADCSPWGHKELDMTEVT